MDGDGNIAEDSSNPRSGWIIRLYQDNGTKGVLDAADVLRDTDTTETTGDTGAYEFKDLGPGDYLVCEVRKTGWTETFPGGADECAFDPALGPDGYAFRVTSGFSETNNDFGNWQHPWSVTLSPPDAVNDVGTDHTVTATVRNISESPMAGVVVRFSTSGSTSASGSCTTDSFGQCSFTYTGPQLPGADIITAYADTNNDGIRDVPDEPQGQATKAWVIPATMPGQVTGGGQIPNAVGNDKVAFGFNAKSTDNKVSGNCTVVDPHPSMDVKIKCLDVTSLVVTGTHATFFGNGTINGTPMTYRIDVDDLHESGRGYDTFKIQTSTGVILGGTLTNGNIQIHK
jgi:hypothetical protein